MTIPHACDILQYFSTVLPTWNGPRCSSFFPLISFFWANSKCKYDNELPFLHHGYEDNILAIDWASYWLCNRFKVNYFGRSTIQNNKVWKVSLLGTAGVGAVEKGTVHEVTVGYWVPLWWCATVDGSLSRCRMDGFNAKSIKSPFYSLKGSCMFWKTNNCLDFWSSYPQLLVIGGLILLPLKQLQKWESRKKCLHYM